MEDVKEEREWLTLALCYTPEGEEEAFEEVEREGSLMIPQRGENLGERLTNCFADLFALGFESVVVIGADSPTLPSEYVFEHLRYTTQPVDGPDNQEEFLPFLKAMRAEKTLLFSTDYPHWDNDDPFKVFTELPLDLKRRIYSENALETFGPEQLVFGSDYPHVPGGIDRFVTILNSVGLSEEQLRMIGRGNATKLIDLEDAPTAGEVKR